MKKLLLILLIPGALLSVIVGGVLFGAVGPIINQKISTINNELSQSSGRSVQLGEVDFRVLPSLVFNIDSINVGEVTGSTWTSTNQRDNQSDFVEVDQVRMEFNTWTALTSLGESIEVDALFIDGIRAVLHRDKEGRWNFEEQGAHSHTQGEDIDAQALVGGVQADSAQEGGVQVGLQSGERQKEDLVAPNIKLQNVALRNVEVLIIDEWNTDTPKQLTFKKMGIELAEFDLYKKISVQIGAALFSEAKNFDLSIELGPFPSEGLVAFSQKQAEQADTAEQEIPFPIKVELKTTQVVFKNLEAFLPENRPFSLADFSMDGGIKIHLSPDEGINISDNLLMNGLKLREVKETSDGTVQVGKWGPDLNLELAPRVNLNPKEGRLTLNDFKVALNDMAILATGEVNGIGPDQNGAPSFKNLGIRSENFNLSRLQKLIPQIGASLPPGAQLGGPFGFKVVATGDENAQNVEAGISLDGSTIIVPEAIHKPAGTPLNFKALVDVSPTLIKLKDIGLTLNDLKIGLSGEVDPVTQRVNVSGGAPNFDINGLMRLAPSVVAAIPAGQQIKGKGSFTLLAKKNGEAVDAELKLGLSGADLSTPDIKLVGGGSVELSVKGDPSKRVDVQVMSSLRELTMQMGELLNKPKGVPMDLNLAVIQQGQNIQIPKLSVQVANLTLQGEGQSSADGVMRFNASLPVTSLGPVIALSPSTQKDQRALSAAKIGFELNTSSKDGAKVLLDRFVFTTPKNSMKGKVSIDSGEKTVVDFNLMMDRFDLDELAPPSDQPANETASTPEGEGSGDMSALEALVFTGKIKIKKGHARGINFKNLDVHINLNQGNLSAPALSLEVFDGVVDMTPLRANLLAAQPTFEANLALKKLDLEELLTVTAEKPKSMAGRLSSQLKVSGTGLTWEEIAPTLSGSGSLDIVKGKIYRLNLPVLIQEEISKKVPGMKRPKGSPDLKFDRVNGSFSIKDGEIKLEEPLKYKTPEGELSQTGHIGLDMNATLVSTLHMPAKRVSKIIGTKIDQKEPIPVSFTLEGPIDDMSVKGLSAAGIIGVAVLALGGGAALKAAAEAKKKAQAELNKAKQKAAAAAKQAKEAARRKAEAAKAAAKKRADAAKAAAKKKADAIKAAAKKKKEAARRRAEAEKKRLKKEAEKRKKEAAKKAKNKLKGLF